MIAMSGRAIAPSAAISPGAFVPISSTRYASRASAARIVRGTPMSLLNERGAAEPRSVVPSAACSSSFVVVLPTDPVMAMTVVEVSVRR